MAVRFAGRRGSGASSCCSAEFSASGRLAGAWRAIGSSVRKGVRLAVLAGFFGPLAWGFVGGVSSPTAAQESPTARGPSLLDLQDALRVEIVQGRLQLLAREAFSWSSAGASTPSGGEEELTIKAVGGVPSLQYARIEADQELTIEIRDATEVRIRRKRRLPSGPMSVEYWQPARGPVQWGYGDGDERKTVRAASLWHLLLLESASTRTELAPLVERLRPAPRLGPLVMQLQAALLRSAEQPAGPARPQLAAWVEQLGDSEFQRRQAADRALRAQGPAVGAYLLALEPARLSVEQRERIRRILDALNGPTPDTPERIAAWLRSDPSIWVEMLQADEVERREAAAEQLERLTGRPVAFDPRADELVRSRQWSELRRQFRPTP